MIDYQEFTLANGLHVIVHEDHTVPTAVVNIMYDVGSRDESADKTGFAHLFEHLMFGGSKNIPDYDTPLQKVGGTNNAFTSPDITNYYVTVPAENLETAFWLESDRMLSLSFDPKVLEVQRKVVIEEFKQRYLNQPYGDIWLKLRPLAYHVHPYQWATIGKDISHIEEATMEDVKNFFHRFYLPNNAVMVVGGNVQLDQVKALAEKWFSSIPKGEKSIRSLPLEPTQTEERKLILEANVPLNSIFKVFHVCKKDDPEYQATDLLSDVLGRGKSSRLYQHLVKKEKVFSSINAYVTGSFDNGLLVVSGRLNPKFTLEEGDQAIQSITNQLVNEGVNEEELQKVKNQAEATLVFSEMEILNRCINLAHNYTMGDLSFINQETQLIQNVNTDDIHTMAKQILKPQNTSTLFYQVAN